MSPSEARRIHIEAWQTSGMSQAAYCREHGLNTRTFDNWVRKHRAGQVMRSPALVPVMSLAMVKETLNNSSNGIKQHLVSSVSTELLRTQATRRYGLPYRFISWLPS